MNKRRQLSPAEIVENLSESLYEAATENEESLNEELRLSGYDPDALRREGKTFIQRLKGQVRLARAKQRRKRLLDFVDHVKESLSSNRDTKYQIGIWLRGEFGHVASNQALQAFYHKLDTIDEEDMKNLAQDAELLQLWEDLEKESEEGKKTP